MKLVTPEFANKIGIYAEAPVFVSAFTIGDQTCPECNMKAKPLVYQARYITSSSHHMHDLEGGIYSFDNLKDLFKSPDYSNTPYDIPFACGKFVALVEPLGKIRRRTFVQENDFPFGGSKIISKYEFVQSEQVNIINIKVIMRPDSSTFAEMANGFIVDFAHCPMFKDTRRYSSLVPMHVGEKLNLSLIGHKLRSKIKYTFKATDTGEILFGNIADI